MVCEGVSQILFCCNLVKVGYKLYPSWTIKGEKIVQDYYDIVCSTKHLATTGNWNQ